MCKSVASQITSENGRISPPGRCAVRFSYFYTSSYRFSYHPASIWQFVLP